MHPVIHGVDDPVEDLQAPRQALGTRTGHPHLSVSIEAEVPEFDPALLVALQQRIKFRMNLIEEVAVLCGERVRLVSVGANGNDFLLRNDDGAMLLPTRDRKAMLHCEVHQLPVLVRINHHKDLAVSPNTLLIHAPITNPK